MSKWSALLSLSQSPLAVVGSSLKGSCHPGLVGETCFLQCPSGHRNSKRTNLVCQIDGSWDGLLDEMSCIPIKPSRKENHQDVVTEKPGVKVELGLKRKSIHCPNITALFSGKTSDQCRPGVSGCWCKVFRPTAYTGYQVIWCKSTGSWSKNGLKCKTKSIFPFRGTKKYFLKGFVRFFLDEIFFSLSFSFVFFRPAILLTSLLEIIREMI